MKKSLVIPLLILSLMVSSFGFVSTDIVHADYNQEVKVKLKNYIKNTNVINISITGEYVLSNDEDIKLTSGKSYKVTFQNSSLNLFEGNSKLYSSKDFITIKPVQYGTSNFVTLNDRKYLGEMKFIIESDKYVRPYNTLPMEDYLKGVVPSEMPAGWHVEALKAQAVAARTYALGKIKSLDDTVSSHVYGGYIWDSKLYVNSNKAVDDTSGQVLTYNGNLISAVYSASNGGHTESNSNYWGTDQVPYLTAKPDSYDLSVLNPYSSWNLNIEKQQINTTNLNLTTPQQWWDSVEEKSLNDAVKNIKAYIQNLHPGANIKIVSVPNITVSGKNSGGKSSNGSIEVKYFVKNKDGSFSRENTDSLPDNYSITHSGETRYDTSVEIAKYGWSNGSNYVILGRGDLPVDALTGSVLAHKLNSPMLLTHSNDLPDNVLNQIKKLNPSKIFILGGTAAISPNVTNKLEADGFETIRVNGKNRYQTSVNIAKEISNNNEVIITGGNTESPDALSAASYAAKNQIPILLTQSSKLSNDVINYLKSKNVEKVYLIGGTVAISEDIEAQIKNMGITIIDRISGKDRYQTSLEVAKYFDFDLNNIFFAQGQVFIDALPGAVLAAQKGAPVILTRKDSLPLESQNWLKSLGQRPMIHYLGGKISISQQARDDIKQSLLGDIKTYTLKRDGIGNLRTIIGTSIFKSYHIDSVTDKSGIITIKGKGFGHGVGMSQYGAQARAKDGITYDKILEFYYEGAKLGK